MKMLLYCTKAKPYLLDLRIMGIGFQCMPSDSMADLNGKIVAECDFKVEEIEHYIHYEPEVDVGVCVLPEFECNAYRTNTLDHFKLLEKSCLRDYSLPNVTVANELDDYLKGKNGYAIHIKNLHIFDEPRELKDYKVVKTYKNGCSRTTLEKAPQNMMKVKEFKDATVKDYILISIQPQWLCKILNGEKTIEVRKKVLKEML